MTNKEALRAMFTTSKRENGEEYIHFTTEAMDKTNPLYPYYRIVSDAMHESGLTHDFSYEIASRAVDAIVENEDNEGDADDLYDLIDSYVPIYNADLMQIYVDNWSAVDEACDDMGHDSGDSIDRARIGWSRAINDIASAILSGLDNMRLEDSFKVNADEK